MNEPGGVVGVVCPEEHGLLDFVSLMGGAMATGNAVALAPSMAQALIATDLYQELDASAVPGGVVNTVTDKQALGLELAKRDVVDAIWYFGAAEAVAEMEKASASNLKPTWTETVIRDWADQAISGGGEVLQRAVQVKNI